MKFFRITCVSFLLCILSFSSYSQLEVIEYKLDNGLTVILNPDKNLNDIVGAVAVNTGSKNDPSDATGISHYLEHLLFKGTDELGTNNYEAEKIHLDSINYYYDRLGETKDEDKRKEIQQIINQHSVAASQYAMPNEFDKLLQSIGSKGINATTNRDLTIYFNTFPSHQIPKWLDLYAHRFTNPVFRSFQSELEVVYEEKNRSMDNMQRRVFDSFNKNFYKGHPYGENHTLGTIEHLKNPSLTKMYEYYNKYYVTTNMALILSGNFNAEEVKPIIEKSFGQLKRKEIDKQEIPAPIPFSGRELIKTRITPIKVGVYAYRTVPRFHEDAAALRVSSYILQNESETGLIDQLVNNNEIMMGFVAGDNTDEAGDMTFFLIPKVFGQSFKKVESLLAQQLEKLKNGDFSDELLTSVKNEIYKNNQLRMENQNGRGYLFAEAFRAGLSWKDMKQELEKVEQISKEDVQRVSKKYFGNDYFVMQSRTGFPKKKKLKKPNFKALKIDQSKESDYAKRFKNLKELSPKEKFIDFEKDLETIELGENSTLYVVENPVNNIYELSIKFHKGELSDNKIEPLSSVMNYAYPQGQQLSEFKEQMGLLGTTISIYSSANTFTIELSGIEKELPRILEKVNLLINQPSINEKSLKTLNNGYKTDRKAEKEEASLIARSIAQYGLYGDKAILRNRLTVKEIKALTIQEYLSLFDEVKSHAVSIHFNGKTASKEIHQLITDKLMLNYDGPSQIPYPYSLQERKENEVYLLDNKKLVQSHLFFVKNLAAYKYDDYAKMKLFNQYFDGGFSGILTQEVREYRSLAYSTTADFSYNFASKPQSYFYTYVGCQGDKTNGAIDITHQLIQDMPEKKERMEITRKNVILGLQSEYPSFRNLSTKVESLKLVGYHDDPNKMYQEQFASSSFQDLTTFYKEEIKSKPIFLGVYGDSKQFDEEELQKIGKLKRIKMEDVIRF